MNNDNLKVGDKVIIRSGDKATVECIMAKKDFVGYDVLVSYIDYEGDLVYELYRKEDLEKVKEFKFKVGDILKYLDVDFPYRKITDIVDNSYIMETKHGEELKNAKEFVESGIYSLVWSEEEK
ncbi:MAG: hypothetical protein ACQEQF_00105 [Bacillota bacterium]